MSEGPECLNIIFSSLLSLIWNQLTVAAISCSAQVAVLQSLAQTNERRPSENIWTDLFMSVFI